MLQFIVLKGVTESKISIILFILIYLDYFDSGLNFCKCSLVKSMKCNYGAHNRVEHNA